MYINKTLQILIPFIITILLPDCLNFNLFCQSNKNEEYCDVAKNFIIKIIEKPYYYTYVLSNSEGVDCKKILDKLNEKSFKHTLDIKMFNLDYIAKNFIEYKGCNFTKINDSLSHFDFVMKYDYYPVFKEFTF